MIKKINVKRITKGKHAGKVKTPTGRILTESQFKFFYPDLAKVLDTI